MARLLPRAFALKLQANGKYLAYVTEDNKAKELLKFYADDINDLTAVFGWEAATREGEGLVFLKCSYNNKYWIRRKSDDSLWIAAEANQPVDDTQSAVFEVFFNGSEINLKQVELGDYVVASPGDEPLNLCLYLGGPNRGGLDTFSLIELDVVSYEISDVKFRLADAKIINPTTAVIAELTLVNNDEVYYETQSGALDYSVGESSTWKLATSSLQPGIPKMNSAIPTIVKDGKVELSGEEITGLYLRDTWEKTVNNKIPYELGLAPKSKVVVTLKATNASADIPFSYTEHFTFANGSKITHHVDDGIFTRFNHYDFKYEGKVIKNYA